MCEGAVSTTGAASASGWRVKLAARFSDSLPLPRFVRYVNLRDVIVEWPVCSVRTYYSRYFIRVATKRANASGVP